MAGMRRALWIAAIAFVGLAGLAAFCLGLPGVRKWLNPPTLRLPNDDEIESLRATLYKSQLAFGTPEFTVPPEHVPRIMAFFRPAHYAARPSISPNDLLGELKITDRRGETTVIRFYWTGQNPALLTVNGEDYFYGSNLATDNGIQAARAIEKAYRDAVELAKE
jgi:hypothetical protein